MRHLTHKEREGSSNVQVYCITETIFRTGISENRASSSNVQVYCITETVPAWP